MSSSLFAENEEEERRRCGKKEQKRHGDGLDKVAEISIGSGEN